jgi:hypothetical protein
LQRTRGGMIDLDRDAGVRCLDEAIEAMGRLGPKPF